MSKIDELQLKPGLTCIEEYIVTEEHTAKHIGSGEVSVLSTPSMILFMERTSLNCVQKHLPNEYTTVGTMISVKHLNPAPIGGVVRVESKLVLVDGRRLVFEVKAYYKDILIGEGQHERFIVNREKFMEKVKKILLEKDK